MTVRIRPGEAADVDAAALVYERSSLARREGAWAEREARVERVRAHLRDPGTWFLVAIDGAVVGMASARALRGEDGMAMPGGCSLSYIYVDPMRWGEGIGGLLLDAVIAEAKRRESSRLHLWTHEVNERSHRLYRSRGFTPTGRTWDNQCEWARLI